MEYKDMLTNARQNLDGYCKVCRVCNGVACAGQTPGMGGKGTGSAFIENTKALDSVKINMRVIHSVTNPDTSVELFGEKFASPIIAAPITGTLYNMGGKLTEREYIQAVVTGCKASNILSSAGDGAMDQLLVDNLDVMHENDIKGIAFIKPWDVDSVIEKIKLAEKAGCIAVGMDIDGCGLTVLSGKGRIIGPKTIEEIRKIKSSTNLPFILKGIMTVEDALYAVEAGVDAIVVSNHGGRVLDQTPGVATVLPAIAKAVNGKIKVFADGSVRTGIDTLKLLGLGADAVLIGRPFVTAAFGGQAEGVEMYVNKVIDELKSAMILTGCQNVEDINSKVIYHQ